MGSDDPLDGTAYRTVRELGRGGMGAVLLAEHVASKQRYAVKLVRDSLVTDPIMRDRFRLEAESIAAIRHQNVVRVLETGALRDGSPFIVMELLQGRSLGELMKREAPIPPQRALAIGIQIAEGLAACHAAGVIHRDIKPDNLFECEGPDPRTIKLTDFGLAKVYTERNAGVRPLEVQTAEGIIVGTPRWCSPEVFFANTTLIDVRSDLYSFGLVLHALVSGKRPWSGSKSEEEIVAAQLRDPLPPLSSPERDLGWLDAIVARLTAKKKEERYDSAEQVSALLRQCLRERYGQDVVLLTTEPIPMNGALAAKQREVAEAKPPAPAAAPSQPRSAGVPPEKASKPARSKRRRRPRPIRDFLEAVPLAIWAAVGVLLSVIVIFSILLLRR